jgi:hypothetical protein
MSRIFLRPTQLNSEIENAGIVFGANLFHSQSITVEKGIPFDVDTGFLTVTDLNPIDEDFYQ